jgi:two-component system, OmpR family, sensor kinase
VRSIRRNLVLWLVGALVLGVIVVLVVTYVLTRLQVGRVFDDELKQVAEAVYLREDWAEERRLRIARPGFFLSVRAYDQSGRIYFETALPSLPPDAPQTFSEGFVFMDTTAGSWRVYTHVAPEGIVQVGQPVATRDTLARDLSLRVLMPLLLLIPVLIALVATVLKRALAPLSETSRRVSDRDASRLDPLPTDNVPEELLPLVEQINALLARLAGSLDAQRRFLADVAHELRSPVAVLALQVQLAERGRTPEAREASFLELKRGTERARRLVQQLLDFARLEPGLQCEPAAPVDIASVVREVVGSFAPHAEELGVDLGADTPAEARMMGIEAELRSLIANLVDNALRYAPRDSVVTVAVRQERAAAVITVVDSGPGIPPGERARVFERFHRVAGDPTPGSGLGLAIVKTIVEHHGGRITLGETYPGAERPGLAVRIEFPARAEGVKPSLSIAPPSSRGVPKPSRTAHPLSSG